ncbi:MAG: enoyl-CoA hydratase/isomerase family protein, partial [Nitratireductor sp.]
KGKLNDPAALDHFIAFGMNNLRALETSSLPVVVAVQGLCLAGGIELMLSCDVCFAAETAQFGDQHAQFGLIPGWGGSQRLTRLMGLRRALDLMFSARWLKADEAKDAGLVNYIVPDADLHQAALEYCQKIATRSRPGIAEMKRLAREGADLGIDQQMRLERDAAVRALPSDDVAEGLDAFENRRAPEFKA